MTTREWVAAGIVVLALSLGSAIGLFVLV